MEAEQARATALAREGLEAMNTGDNANARRLFEECKAIREAIGDRIGVGKALNNLGNITAQEGDEEGARALWQQSLELQRDINNPLGMHCPIANMSALAFRQGNYTLMQDLDTQMVDLARVMDDKGFLAHSLDGLAQTAIYAQDYPSARQAEQESLTLKQELDLRETLPSSLEVCANLAGAEQDFERAALFYGAYAKQRALQDRPQHPQEKASLNAAMAALESTMGEAAYRSAYSTGKLMNAEQALHAAIDFCAAPVGERPSAGVQG